MNFIDPISQAHTQSIEAFWSVIKRKLRKYGTNHGDFEETMRYVYEIIAKRIYAKDLFDLLLYALLNWE